jgi:uncharacterized membrane protein YdbT with pleckstrin-like domain
MRYIDRIRQPGENLVYTSRLHWIVYVPGLLLWVAALIVLYVVGAASPRIVWLILFAVLAFAASILLLRAWIRRWTTEIDVTDRRIVYKRGLIRRHTVEMNMDKVESVDVDQTIMGRLLDYGNIVIHGTGRGIEPLRNIDAPLEFRNKVTAR